jgi:hypothetical protein
MKLLVVNLPVAEIVQVGTVTIFVGVLKTLAGATVHEPVSPEAKPLPDIVTEVPAGPEFGESVSVGFVEATVKIAEAKSPPLAVTVTT